MDASLARTSMVLPPTLPSHRHRSRHPTTRTIIVAAVFALRLRPHHRRRTQKNRTPATHARTGAPVPHVNSTAATNHCGRHERTPRRSAFRTTTERRSTAARTHKNQYTRRPRRSTRVTPSFPLALLPALSFAHLSHRAPSRRTTAAAAAVIQKTESARAHALARSHRHTDERFAARRSSHKTLQCSVSHVLCIRSVVVRSHSRVTLHFSTLHTPPPNIYTTLLLYPPYLNNIP